MKKTIYTFLALCLAMQSCALFELDNMPAPAETLKGKVTDIATGDPVLTDQGSEGIRVRITELSYGDNVQHNPDFNCRPNGTFTNTKVFKGFYNIRVDGPFIPIVREDADGNILFDGSVNTEIKGVTEVNFEVQPFLKVEFADVPQISNGKITTKVKVTRAVSVEEFRKKIEPMGDYNDAFPNVTDIQLFVSYSSSVGYRARDTRWSNEIKYTGNTFEEKLGKSVTIGTNGTIPSGRKVFIRAAARINYATPAGSGTKRWNYSEPMEIDVP